MIRVSLEFQFISHHVDSCHKSIILKKFSRGSFKPLAFTYQWRLTKIEMLLHENTIDFWKIFLDFFWKFKPFTERFLSSNCNISNTIIKNLFIGPKIWRVLMICDRYKNQLNVWHKASYLDAWCHVSNTLFLTLNSAIIKISLLLNFTFTEEIQTDYINQIYKNLCIRLKVY